MINEQKVGWLVGWLNKQKYKMMICKKECKIKTCNTNIKLRCMKKRKNLDVQKED